MKKLKLETEQLAVESFATSPTMEAHGTVLGLGKGTTRDAVATCGPQTCGDLACAFETDFPCDDTTTGGGGIGGGGGSPSGMLSCLGCTTQNYTNAGGDSCAYCLSLISDSPARCPCP